MHVTHANQIVSLETKQTLVSKPRFAYLFFYTNNMRLHKCPQLIDQLLIRYLSVFIFLLST